MDFVYYDNLSQKAKTAFDNNENSNNFIIDKRLNLIALKNEYGKVIKVIKVIFCKSLDILQVNL